MTIPHSLKKEMNTEQHQQHDYPFYELEPKSFYLFLCLIWTVSAMFSVHIMSYFDA